MSNREALLEGAKTCLRERGYARTTARDLVAASGTNLSSIGYHFGSKEALLAEAFDEIFVEWTNSLTDVARNSALATALERVQQAWKSMLERLPEQQDFMLAFVESLGPSIRSPELRVGLARHYDRVRADIADVVRSDLGDAGVEADVDPMLVASFLIAVADGFMIQFLIDPASCPTGDQFVEGMTAAAVAATFPADSRSE
jgi:AcrR family transcriptional regulator